MPTHVARNLTSLATDSLTRLIFLPGQLPVRFSIFGGSTVTMTTNAQKSGNSALKA